MPLIVEFKLRFKIVIVFQKLGSRSRLVLCWTLGCLARPGGGDGERGRLALGDRYVDATEFSVDPFSDSVGK